MILLLLASAISQPDVGLMPDIVVDARAQIREVRIQQRGQASLDVRGGPGSDVKVEKPPTGETRLRNVNVSVRAEARVADPQQISAAPETARPD